MSGKPQRIGYIVALCGIMSSLALVVMFVFGFVPTLEYLTPALAGVLIYVIRESLGVKYGLVSYVAVGILCVLITSNYEVAMLFIFLLGYYPILREFLQKIKLRLLRGLVKFAVFTVSSLSCYGLLIYVFGMVYLLEEMNEFGQFGVVFVFALSLAAFVAYDIFLGYFKPFYEKIIKPKIQKRIR